MEEQHHKFNIEHFTPVSTTVKKIKILWYKQDGSGSIRKIIITDELITIKEENGQTKEIETETKKEWYEEETQ